MSGATLGPGDASPGPGPAIGVTVVIPVAWGEMDALGHVNNVVYFRYFECARVALLRSVGWFNGDSAGRSPDAPGAILHSVSARFRAAVEYPDTLAVRAYVTSIESDRVTIAHEITSRSQDRIVTEGSGIVVAYDYERKAKSSIPPEIAERLAGHMQRST